LRDEANVISRVGDVSLTWGESLRWDDARQRLYFVDCATRTLHWLDRGEPPLQVFELPGMPTGVVLTEGSELVVCLDDGLHIVDPDMGTTTLLTEYPDGLHGRANDAAADGHGNLVTGTLNLSPGPGAFWWFSAADGWRPLDEGTGNANGPVVLRGEDQETLFFADTLARVVYAYRYDGEAGHVADRRIYADHASLDGAPDGATLDSEGGLWSCVLGAAKLARFTPEGLQRSIELPVPNPTDVAFAGRGYNRLFVTSIGIDIGDGPPPEEAGSLLTIEGLDVSGAPEARFQLR
jgi:L-arabinonolactonase